MKLGVDIRNLQSDSQFRGIGEVTRRSLYSLFQKVLEKQLQWEFIFYVYNREPDPFQFFDVPSGIKWSKVYIDLRKEKNNNNSRIDNILRIFNDIFFHTIPNYNLDVFLQFEYTFGIPKKVPTILIKYDIIPIIFKEVYIHKPKIRDLIHFRFKKFIFDWLKKIKFYRMLRISVSRAKVLLCISKYSMEDIHNYLGVPYKKMKLWYLGANNSHLKSPTTKIDTSYQSISFDKPTLFWVGGIYPLRRPLEDLIYAYDILKNEGLDIQVVICSKITDTEFQNLPISKAIKNSKFKEDIKILNYISDNAKHELYKKSLALVFPSNYEGFGLPILEAMLNECPVIAYKNSSIPEVAGEHAFYAKGHLGIVEQVKFLLGLSPEEIKEKKRNALEHAKSFTWDKPVEILFKEILNQSKKY